MSNADSANAINEEQVQNTQTRQSYKLWIRVVAFVLAIVIVFELTSVDISLLKYSGSHKVAAQYLLSSTSYIQGNRFERLKDLLKSLTPYDTNLNAAEMAIAKADYSSAAVFLSNAIAECTEPSELTDLYDRLGCVYMMVELPEEAEAAFQSSIALAPENPTAYVLRSQLRYTSGDLEGAAADAKQYIELGGKDMDMLIAAESLCELGGELDAAAAALSTMAELAPDAGSSARYRAELGRVQYLQGDNAGAARNIRQAREEAPSVLDGVHYAIIALFEFEAEDYAQSRGDFLEAARRSDSDNAQYYEQAILCNYLLEDYEALMTAAEEADTKNMMTPLALMLNGVALFLSEDYETAETVLTRSLDTGEVIPEIYYYRGLVRLALGSYTAAAEDFDTSAQRSENRLESIYNLGVCYFAEGKFEEAVEQFLAVINDGTNPDLAQSAYELIEPFLQ